MGQQNNSGRNASLGQNKERAAGRQNTNSSQQEAIRDSEFDKGKTSGALAKMVKLIARAAAAWALAVVVAVPTHERGI